MSDWPGLGPCVPWLRPGVPACLLRLSAGQRALHARSGAAPPMHTPLPCRAFWVKRWNEGRKGKRKGKAGFEWVPAAEPLFKQLRVHRGNNFVHSAFGFGNATALIK